MRIIREFKIMKEDFMGKKYKKIFMCINKKG